MYGCKCAFIFASRIEQLAQNYTVPTYEEVVMSGQYPISQSSERHNSITQLPAYEELGEDQHTVEDGFSPARRRSSQIDPSTGAGGRRNSRPGRKLIPLKIRRIKSDNLRRKSLSDIQQTNVFTIEPLTPPPQYDAKLPPLPTNAQQWGVLEVYTNTAVWWSVPTSFTHYYCTELHIPPLERMCQYQQHRGGSSMERWRAFIMSSCVAEYFLCSKKKKNYKKVAADWIKTELDFWKMFTELLLVFI